ncbi:hypothetical protein P8C59_000550 [Phyllachora maydis]|uniref:Reverse transcriptase Ty1/copia-type domain-containing protein n=1 Tax=Phyllachora maydis TaxID=1825666 RepID=A0AAD9HWK6_9PEZI|nr:hypothetical protein P8C59_000550 [Phyllachora maydis]
MHLLRRSCRVEGRNGAGGPLPPIRTLLEDEEDGEDYSEVIEVLKQHIKSYERDSVSAIKNISSTLASLTNSSNAAAATIGKTSYSPRFDPFSGTMDLDSPLRPPRKEPYLGPAVNSATSNLDPPIDIGSKEGFKDTITSSIVKELSKKAYTIPDDTIEEEEESNSSSNSSSSSDSNTQLAQLLALKGYKKRKDFKGKGLKTSSNNKAKYKDNKPRRRPRDPALYNSWLYDTGSTDHISNSKERFTTFTPNIGQLRPINTGNGPVSPAGIGSITLEVLSRKAPPTYTKLVLDNVLYLPNIDINIISGTREPKPLTGTGDLPRVLREPVIEGNKVEKAISSPTLKEPNIGQRDYYNLLNLAKLWYVRLGHIGLRLLKKTSSITKGLPNFNKIKEADFHCSSYDRGKAVRRVSKALIPDLPRVLDSIEGDTVKIRPRPYNRNPIVLLLVNRKSSKTYLVYIPSRRAVLKTSTIKFIEDNTVLSQPTNNTALEGELVDLDLDLEGAVSLDPSNLNTEKPISIEIGPSKLEPYESSSDSKLDEPLLDKPINPVIVESTRPTISIRKPELPEAEEIYIEIPKGLLDLAASNKAIYKLLLKYGYNPSTPNIIKLSKALYGLKQSPREWQDKLKILLKSLGYLPLILDLGVFYNAKTCHFIVTYIDNCLFIGPNIGYITDLKKRLNKVYAIEDLGPTAYFLGVQIIRDRPNRRLWLNQSQYVEEAVSRFNLADSKPISIPL